MLTLGRWLQTVLTLGKWLQSEMMAWERRGYKERVGRLELELHTAMEELVQCGKCAEICRENYLFISYVFRLKFGLITSLRVLP